MKILVSDSDLAAAARVSALLRSDGHEVTTAPDEPTTVQLASRGGLHALLVVSRSGDDTAVRLVKRVRDLPSAGGLLLLFLAAKPEEGSLLAAYQAGVDLDGFLSQGDKVLAARLRALERRWLSAASRTSPAAPAGGALGPADAASPLDRVAHSKSWTGAEPAFQNAGGTFLRMPVTTAVAPTSSVALTRAVRTVMVSSALQLELAVTLGGTAKSCDALAVSLFGEASAELVKDTLGELNNVLMGTLKSGLSAEGLPFTAGLPAELPAEEVLRPSVSFTQQAAFSLRVGDALIAVHLGLRSRANERIPPHLLKEGMVVAHDICNARGLLLLNKGTRLSLNMVDRLRANLPARSLVEVLAP